MMLQFTPEEQATLRQRAGMQPQIIQRLISDNRTVLAHPLLVPETGIATWGHYYFCPHHGVKLIWDRYQPQQHRCPVDNEILSGESYDGAWWRILNGHNCQASYQLGLLWMLTQETHFAQKVQDILLTYARYYPDYVEHGGIPCNGPGKMNIQTLCEANCLLELAKGYDLIRETLSPTQQETIEERLFRPAATFLCAHRENQLHNHEVKVNVAIGVLGLVLNDEQLMHFAIAQTYGLRWQLQHGLYEEGLWFEGSTHYHFYVLQGYFDWEKFARRTPWSLMDEGLYEKMLDFPLSLLAPDGAFPMINDAVSGQNQLHHYDIYEFAYQHYHKPAYAAALTLMYRSQPRNNLDAFLYGSATLPNDATLDQPNVVHAPDCGLTLIRQPDANHALLIKHMPFSGEHDHHDYLALTLWRHGHAVLPDLGTTGYGATLHRAYYKNSATHNTLSVNLTNAPPTRPETRCITTTAQGQQLVFHADWRKTPAPLPTFSLHEWDEEAWRDIQFTRHLVVNEEMIIDIAHIENPHIQSLYWTLLVEGEKTDRESDFLPGNSTELIGPLAHLRNVTQSPLNGAIRKCFRTVQGEFTLWLAGDGQLYEGVGPANPAIHDVSYLVMNSIAPQMQLLSCYLLDSTLELENLHVDWHNDHCVIRYILGHEERQMNVQLNM